MSILCRVALVVIGLGCGFMLLAQKDTLQIEIRTIEGAPAEAATVASINQDWYTITDADGRTHIPFADTVSISFLGMSPQLLSWEELQENRGRVTLAAMPLELATVAISAPAYRPQLGQEQFVIAPHTLRTLQAATPADALAIQGGAFVQKSQQGGGSPVLRGFEGNRVLLVVDDVRLNNAIYRNGHLQNAITVDENALQQIDVSYGPGAVAYGSDALGGVVHFRTKSYQPERRQDRSAKLTGLAHAQYSTASRAPVLHAQLARLGRRWTSFSAITLSRFGDLVAGQHRPDEYPGFGERNSYIERENGRDVIRTSSTPNRQIGSAYEQLDVLQNFVVDITDNWQFKLNAQYSTSSEVPRYDRLAEDRDSQLRWAEWYYGPQERALLALTNKWTMRRKWLNDPQLTYAYQRIKEDRYQRRLFDDWREASLVQVDVHSFDFRTYIQPIYNWPGIYIGAEYYYNDVVSEAWLQQVDTGQQMAGVNTRYPSQGSSMHSWHIYVHTQRQLWRRLQLELGGRYSQQSLQAVFGADDPVTWPADFVAGLENKNKALTGALGLSCKLKRWHWEGHLATGFRAPNIDDFAKFRERNGFVQVPNTALLPERLRSVETSLQYGYADRNFVKLTVYRNWLQDAIVRQNATLPNGDAFFLDRGDTLFVQTNTNASSARLWGLSLRGQYAYERWQLSGQLHYTYGRRPFKLTDGRQLDVPLDHIPPMYGLIQLAYEQSSWNISVQYRFQIRKKLEDYAVSGIVVASDGQLILDRTGSSDNLEQTPIDPVSGVFSGTYGWGIVNLQCSKQIQSVYRVQLQLENLFDLHYRTFSSGISAPGRQLVLGGYMRF